MVNDVPPAKTRFQPPRRAILGGALCVLLWGTYEAIEKGAREALGMSPIIIGITAPMTFLHVKTHIFCGKCASLVR